MDQFSAMWPYIAVAVGAGLAGALLAGFWQPSRQWKSYVQHFAAGLVLAAVAVELMPEIERGEHAEIPALFGFILGSGCMAAWKYFAEKLERRTGDVGLKPGGPGGIRGSIGLLVTAATDTFVDGLVIGAGFATGGETGPLLAIGLSIELMFLTLSAGIAVARGSSRVVTIAASGSISLFVVLGAVAGLVVLSLAPEAYRYGTLAFGGAALLYLVTEELLIEAHEQYEAWLAAAVMFGGFIVFWVIRILH